jgi:hypothetical protein
MQPLPGRKPTINRNERFDEKCSTEDPMSHSEPVATVPEQVIV